MRFGDSRVQALAGALCRHFVRRHRHHQQEPARPDDRTARRPVRHDPGLLRPGPAARNGLITRRPHANTYDLTPDGLAIRDLLHQGPRSRPDPAIRRRRSRKRRPSSAAALRTIEHHINQLLAARQAAYGSLTNSAQLSKSSPQRVAETFRTMTDRAISASAVVVLMRQAGSGPYRRRYDRDGAA